MRERSVRSLAELCPPRAPCLHFLCTPPAQGAGTIPRPSPQIWCSDASSPSAATGTVRLQAFSHARGLMLGQGSPRSSPALESPPLHCHWPSPKPSPMPALPACEWQGDLDLQLLHLIRLCLLASNPRLPHRVH